MSEGRSIKAERAGRGPITVHRARSQEVSLSCVRVSTGGRVHWGWGRVGIPLLGMEDARSHGNVERAVSGDRAGVGEGSLEERGARSFPSRLCPTPRPRSCCYSPWTSGSSEPRWRRHP